MSKVGALPAAVAAAATVTALGLYYLHRRRAQQLDRSDAPPSPPPRKQQQPPLPLQESSSAAEAFATDEKKAAALRSPATVEDSSRVRKLDLSDSADDEPAAKVGGAFEAARAVNKANKDVVRRWESREWEKARQRSAVMQARIAAREAAGIPDPVKEKSRMFLEAARAAAGEDAAEAEAEAEAPSDAPEASSGASAALPALPGATDATVAAELRRWPLPPAGAAGCQRELVPHVWPLYYDHFDWLDEVAAAYAFADAGEVLRHLIFVANGESAQVKKLIFKVIRCLHCHSGTRATAIPKKDKPLDVFDFQEVWLTNVQTHSSHPTVEKTVRVLLDYYRKVTSDKPSAEAELFWKHRTDVTRSGGASRGGGSFGAYMAGVPGNFFPRPAAAEEQQQA